MDFILCRNCEQGNPSYLRLCSNCNTDLFAENVENPTLPFVAEENSENLRRMAMIAIIFSIFTTVFKIWFLYSLKANSYRDFPTISDILLILSPIIITALTSVKTNKWYRVLLVDSTLMAILFVFGLFFFLYGVMK